MGAAVQEYRRALAETRDSVPIMNRLAWVLMELNRHEEALELLKRGREISPDHPTIYTYLGQTYLKLKDFKETKEAFQTSIQLNPFNPEVHEGLASVYEMMGDSSAALKEKEITRRLIR